MSRVWEGGSVDKIIRSLSFVQSKSVSPWLFWQSAARMGIEVSYNDLISRCILLRVSRLRVPGGV